MAHLNPGDRIDCKIKHGVIVNPYENDYQEVRRFEIIGTDHYGYHLYVPEYFMIKDTKRLDCYSCKDLRIDERFIGEEILYIKENLVYKVSYIFDGAFCEKCKTFYQYAVKGYGKFLCWGCENIQSDE